MATETINIPHADYAALCAELDALRAKTKDQAQQINELNTRGLELIVTLADAQQRVADLEFAADTKRDPFLSYCHNRDEDWRGEMPHPKEQK